MDIQAGLKQALDDGAYIRLNLEEEGHEGFVVGLSSTFVLLQAVFEWQDIGAIIIPLDAVESCDVSDYHDDQLKIIAFNSVKRTKRYNGVNLSSFADLFRSLKPRGKFIVVSVGDEADVGLIEDIGKDSVILKAVDPGGNWIEDTVECPYDEITAIQVDDNYSRVLQRYIERAPALN